MAEFSDVVKALIEETKSGKLEWQIGTDSGGYWHTRCKEMRFQVRTSGLVEVVGSVPSLALGTAPELAEVLQQCKPLSLEATREAVLKRAIECLRGE